LPFGHFYTDLSINVSESSCCKFNTKNLLSYNFIVKIDDKKFFYFLEKEDFPAF